MPSVPRYVLPPLHPGKGQQKVYCSDACRKAHHAASKIAAAVAAAEKEAEIKIQTAREEAWRDAFAERERLAPSGDLALNSAQTVSGHTRLAFLVDGAPVDEANAAAYNALHLQAVDQWDIEKLVWEVSFANDMNVFQPLLVIAELPRSTTEKNQGHVLLQTEPEVFWLNEDGDEVAGFQGYNASQSISMVELAGRKRGLQHEA